MRNILVVFGGKSCEREISVLTGVTVAAALDGNFFDPVPLYIDGNGKFFTGKGYLDLDNYKKGKFGKTYEATFFPGDDKIYVKRGRKVKPVCPITAVINCCHGGTGEDGALSGYFTSLGFPLCSPDHVSSGIAMNKIRTKQFLKGIGVKSLPYIA
ncbi:MAG: hypothetical protein MJ072_01860, partial [Clostridia bacterium]|nr:hypothetical protein [Clostridia bacterium]